MIVCNPLILRLRPLVVDYPNISDLVAMQIQTLYKKKCALSLLGCILLVMSFGKSLVANRPAGSCHEEMLIQHPSIGSSLCLVIQI